MLAFDRVSVQMEYSIRICTSIRTYVYQETFLQRLSSKLTTLQPVTCGTQPTGVNFPHGRVSAPAQTRLVQVSLAGHGSSSHDDALFE